MPLTESLAGTFHLCTQQTLTSKFSKPNISKMPMDLKLSFPLIFWLILAMIQEKHWEYNAMATESRESIAFRKQGRDEY